MIARRQKIYEKRKFIWLIDDYLLQIEQEHVFSTLEKALLSLS